MLSSIFQTETRIGSTEPFVFRSTQICHFFHILFYHKFHLIFPLIYLVALCKFKPCVNEQIPHNQGYIITPLSRIQYSVTAG